MFDRKFSEEINATISEVIAASPAKDIEKNMKAMMTAMFAKLDLVTREEFDMQMQALQRSRKKLDALEARLVQMDMSSAEPSPGA
jgi:ubiquinone biosynthesis accessory factor UbiK